MGAQQSAVELQSYEVPDSATPERVVDGVVVEPACSPIYRSLESRDGLMLRAFPEATTIYEVFLRGYSMSKDRNCLGVRSRNPDGTAGAYVWQSYQTVLDRIHAFGAGVRHLGVAPGAHMGIYSINRPEWTIAELGGYSQRIINIALYDTLGPEAAEYIVGQAEISLVVCSADKTAKVIAVANKVPVIKLIIQMDGELSEESKAAAAAANIDLKTFAEIEALGKANPVDVVKPQPADYATIMYTSGTTGMPKGVILTHQNVVAAVSSAASQSIGINFTPNDSYISYLPLAHIFERVVQGAIFMYGGSAGFFQGDVLKLVDDIGELKPTIFPSVPRLFNRIFDKVMQGVAQKSAIEQWLFRSAFDSKKSQIAANGKQPASFLDGLVFEKVKARLGGRVRLMVTGSAPISHEVFNFLQIAFCCPVLNGYGMTETSAAVSIMRSVDFVYSTGPPVPAIELKLREVPEMNYFARDRCGEVVVRGPGVFSGYYKEPAKTKEVLDENGWLATGDIGRINPNGTLSIIDRKKSIFKLSQGEYVAPEHLENIFSAHPLIAMVWVYGDSLQSALVAVVVPDFETLKPFLTERNITGDNAAIAAHPDVKQKMMEALTEAGKARKIRGFEFIKAVHVEHQPFTVERNQLTPTFKIRRVDMQKCYQDKINEMYAQVNAAAAKAGGSA
jgi:long-chain acyl-CoA synthetase